MFEDSLIESAANSTALLHSRSRWPVMLSIAAQFAAAAALLALPLLHPEALPLTRALTATLAPPRPPVPPPRPIHIRATEASGSVRAPANTTTAPGTNAPILPTTLHPSGTPADAPSLTLLNMSSQPPGIPASTSGTGPHVTVAAPKARAPARISSGVSTGLLLSPLRPEYPPIARITHTEGTVIVEATISRTGIIEDAHILSGPPMLQQAALDAVRHARYRPYMLNGQPTEVQTTFTIRFRMGG